MSGVVTFFWLNDDGDANYARIPRDEVRGVRLSHDADEVDILLLGASSDISIQIDPTDQGMDDEQARKIGNKMVDSIRSLTDENISWEHDGQRWKQTASKNSDVWGISR